MLNVATTIRSTACLKTLRTLLIGLAAFIAAHQGPYLPPGCEKLEVDAGNVVSFHAFASGVQIYRWNATTSKWDLLGPDATLFADAGLKAVVGTHYVGPTWETTSGSAVVGTVVESALPDTTTIRWLKLAAVSSHGPGVLAGTTFIQRVNTTGGLAPANAGSPNEIVEVPYTAEYYFYRAP
jgi:hypothetical protein